MVVVPSWSSFFFVGSFSNLIFPFLSVIARSISTFSLSISLYFYLLSLYLSMSSLSLCPLVVTAIPHTGRPSTSTTTSTSLREPPPSHSGSQSQLGTLVGASSGYVESLPKLVRNRIHALEQMHTEQAKLQYQFRQEVLELEKKFARLYEPLFEKVRFG